MLIVWDYNCVEVFVFMANTTRPLLIELSSGNQFGFVSSFWLKKQDAGVGGLGGGG